MSYGVTLTGFVRKHLTDLLTELQSAVKDAFGRDKRVDAKSPIGILLSIFAQPLAEVWEVMQSVYSAFDPDSAEGAAQDTVLNLTGLTRKSLVYSTVDEVLVGAVGTQIPAGSIVRTSDAGDQFETTTSNTLGLSACTQATIEISTTVANGVIYQISINGHTYTKVAGGADTPTTVFAALETLIDTGPDAALVTTTATTTMVLAAVGDTAFSLSVSATLTTSSVGNLATMQAVSEGAIPAYQYKLTEIVTPVAGWTSATNPADASLGAALELDAAARQRRAVSLAAPGSTTVDAIRAKLLQISGVTNCTVYTNRTDAVDANLLLPHSNLAVLLGGTPAVIAQCLWDNWGGGIGFNVGNASFPTITSTTAIDSQGISQAVGFLRPTDVDMWVKLTFTENTEEELPSTYSALMLAAALLVGYAHQPGEDVLPARFHGPVFDACEGIRTLIVEVALDTGGSPGSYQATPYAIAVTQIARFDSLRITVVKS